MPTWLLHEKCDIYIREERTQTQTCPLCWNTDQDTQENSRYREQEVQRRMVLVVNFFFHIYEIDFNFFVVAIFDQMHDVEA